jgi:DNA repair protein RadA/Sms
VLTRRAGVRVDDLDVFVNVVAGMRIGEPAADLAVAAAVASSIKDRPVAADTALIGEVGLSGELRAVPQMGHRLQEAAKLGFKRVIVPKRIRAEGKLPSQVEVLSIRSLREALDELFSSS